MSFGDVSVSPIRGSIYSIVSFKILQKDPQNRARLGTLVTAHSEIPTPIFMPVGTQGTVKAMLPQSLHQIDAKIILGNTYHLYLRPGSPRAGQTVGGTAQIYGLGSFDFDRQWRISGIQSWGSTGH